MKKCKIKTSLDKTGIDFMIFIFIFVENGLYHIAIHDTDSKASSKLCCKLNLLLVSGKPLDSMSLIGAIKR